MIECQAAKDALLNMNNVVGAATGVKWVNGTPTDQPAILVFVEKKLSKRSIMSKFAAESVVPESLNGFPTDVIEVGKIVKQAFTNRIRPIQPGYSCGQRLITAGTIGGVFIDRDGDPVILSNNHVLANENRAAIGDPIYQPGPADARGDLNFKGWVDPVADLPYFATLKKFNKLEVSGQNLHDSAIAKIHEKIIAANLVNPVYPTINAALSGFGNAQVNTQVQKCGRTTGYTTGRVIAVGGSFTVGYDIGGVRFNQCLVMTGMSKGGDSGSIIADMNMHAVGLLFAGSGKVTLAHPIGLVVDAYGLNIWDHNKVRDVIEFSDSTWSIFKPTDTQVVKTSEFVRITAPANQSCYLEHKLTEFASAQVTVNFGTDRGTAWGPGLVIQWPNGMLKVNLRFGGTFGGYYNATANTSIGKVQPNTEYVLRIRKTTNSYLGEVQDRGKWTTVIEIPQSLMTGNPIAVRVGKTDTNGGSAPHTALAAVGMCSFKGLDIK